MGTLGDKIIVNVLDNGDITEKMKPKEREKFLYRCYRISKEGVFKKIYDDLVSREIVFLARQAVNMEQLSFGRGGINGLDLFAEAIEKYANIYESEYVKQDDDFDKNSIFD